MWTTALCLLWVPAAPVMQPTSPDRTSQARPAPPPPVRTCGSPATPPITRRWSGPVTISRSGWPAGSRIPLPGCGTWSCPESIITCHTRSSPSRTTEVCRPSSTAPSAASWPPPTAEAMWPPEPSLPKTCPPPTATSTRSLLRPPVPAAEAAEAAAVIPAGAARPPAERPSIPAEAKPRRRQRKRPLRRLRRRQPNMPNLSHRTVAPRGDGPILSEPTENEGAGVKNLSLGRELLYCHRRTNVLE